MQKNKPIKYISAFMGVVFVAVLATETLHFLLIKHEQNQIINSEKEIVSQVLSGIHSCDFKFIKTPFKFSTEINIKEFINIIFSKKVLFTKNELAKNSIKYTFSLRGPPAAVS